MKNFAQRDFVNATTNQAQIAESTTIPDMIGKVITLSLSTVGLVFILAFMWLAHQ